MRVWLRRSRITLRQKGFSVCDCRVTTFDRLRQEDRERLVAQHQYPLIGKRLADTHEIEWLPANSGRVAYRVLHRGAQRRACRQSVAPGLLVASCRIWTVFKFCAHRTQRQRKWTSHNESSEFNYFKLLSEN